MALVCDGCGKPVRDTGRKLVVVVDVWGAPGAQPADIGSADVCDACAAALLVQLRAVVQAVKKPAAVSAAAALTSAARAQRGGLGAVIDQIGAPADVVHRDVPAGTLRDLGLDVG